MRVEHLRSATFAAPEVDRVAAHPRIRRVAHGAERFFLRERSPAVIAGYGIVGEVDIVFATDFATPGATPTNCHRLTPPPLLERLITLIIACENLIAWCGRTIPCVVPR